MFGMCQFLSVLIMGGAVSQCAPTRVRPVPADSGHAPAMNWRRDIGGLRVQLATDAPSPQYRQLYFLVNRGGRAAVQSRSKAAKGA
jgi:hypothetical protein